MDKECAQQESDFYLTTQCWEIEYSVFANRFDLKPEDDVSQANKPLHPISAIIEIIHRLISSLQMDDVV